MKRCHLVFIYKLGHHTHPTLIVTIFRHTNSIQEVKGYVTPTPTTHKWILWSPGSRQERDVWCFCA